jgi:2,3-bisphosphoglycerate-dependent phosphoglycerate mutase
VRHGESPKADGNESARGLTDKGKRDAERITNLLMNEGIEAFFSSPYMRAVLTIEDLAKAVDKEIQIYEDLKELVFSSDDKIMPDHELYPVVSKMFSNRELSSPGGESVLGCQTRSVAILKEILKQNCGQRIVIGTHGAVMTLMMEHFNRKYNFEFLMKTSKPDIYKMIFDNEELIDVERLWTE